MSDTVIKAENLGKKYIIGHQAEKGRYVALRDVMAQSVRTLWNKTKDLAKGKAIIQGDKTEEIWALKDVSFEIRRGESVGIIGDNGAGKSTLLKILSRITEPSAGRVAIKGRVASLLEIGTGFHQEMTGRENIVLNGAILGMTRAEVKRKFDEIVDFAEIEKFLDTPVKRYSSGMYVRLAFAVAAHLEPEILLVDEVLAVGDAAFQKKCLGKMGDVAKEGRTILFVSHNMGAIAKLCNRSILLDKGKIVLDGLSSEVLNRYQSQYLTFSPEWRRPHPEKADGDFIFLSIAAKDRGGRINALFRGDDPIGIEICYDVRHSLSGCQIGVRIYNSEGLVVFSSGDSDNSGYSALPKDVGKYRTLFTIPGNILAPGTYYLFVAAHLPFRTLFEVIEKTIVFEIGVQGSLTSLDGRLGVIAPLLSWETIKEPVL